MRDRECTQGLLEKRTPVRTGPPGTQGGGSVVGRDRKENAAQEVTTETSWGPHTYLSIDVSDLPSQDHAADGPLHLLPFERGPAGLGEGHVARDGPLMLQIHLPGGSRVTQG